MGITDLVLTLKTGSMPALTPMTKMPFYLAILNPEEQELDWEDLRDSQTVLYSITLREKNTTYSAALAIACRIAPTGLQERPS